MAQRRMTGSSLITVRWSRAGYLEGIARPGSGRHGDILASFMQSDVQGDLACARTLLAEIAAAERGEAPQPAAVGNAFSIGIAPDGVTIRNAVVAEARAEKYDFGELRQVLEAWIAEIERIRRNLA
jgi:hypothetical protein